eukprot:gene2506-5436_t
MDLDHCITVVIVSLLLYFPQQTIPVVSAQCTLHSKGAVSKSGLYCLCVSGTSCFGQGCKKGYIENKPVQGFPQDCVDCICVPDDQRKVLRKKSTQNDIVMSSASRNSSHTIQNVHSKQKESTEAILPNIIFIKTYKVATRHNSVQLRSKNSFNIIYGHNVYDMETQPAGSIAACQVRQREDGKWTYCGGYQPWMDEYVPHAVHFVMVAEPLERIASMYYYEQGFTKLRERVPGETSYHRLSRETRTYHNFYNTDPRGKDESYIKRWLKNDFIAKWERVQWWWLRESTETRELSETIELMQSRFLVGVRERMYDTMLIWKSSLQLSIRDIIFTSVKAQLSHPSFDDWSKSTKLIAKDIVKNTGDDVYYIAAKEQFEEQVKAYGRDRLENETRIFKHLLEFLELKCNESVVSTETLHIPDRVYCMLRAYDDIYGRVPYNSSFSLKLLSSTMTVGECSQRCRRENLDYIGLFFGENCFCGREPLRDDFRVADVNCNKKCPGETKRMCGGGEHFSVYVNNKKDRLRYDANHTDAVVSEKSNGEIYDDDLRIISTFLHQ